MSAQEGVIAAAAAPAAPRTPRPSAAHLRPRLCRRRAVRLLPRSSSIRGGWLAISVALMTFPSSLIWLALNSLPQGAVLGALVGLVPEALAEAGRRPSPP